MRRRTSTLWLPVWLALAVVLHAAAADIRVTPLVSGGQVSASFSVPDGFDDDARAILNSGLLLTFSYIVELRRPSTLWLDDTLSATTVSATAKFDRLAGVYQVTRLDDGKVTWSERTADAAQVRAWMTQFERVPLVPTEPLHPNGDYYVRVRMQASPRRTLSVWPWLAGCSGRAAFTFIR